MILKVIYAAEAGLQSSTRPGTFGSTLGGRVYELSEVKPGDILCVRTGNDLGDQAIRLGAALENEPNLDNHVVVVHHTDAANTLWGIEGRPGGVGWVDIAQYVNAYLVHNAEQPKTDVQRDSITQRAQLMLGTPYDWQAIASDTAMALLHMNSLWGSKDFGPLVPGQVVCSSLAWYLYDSVSLAHPTQHRGRYTTPADWTQFILTQGWHK